MLIAIFSDVHSNLEALTAVLEDIKKEAPDRVLFLGDAVGYGPDPNECVERIFEVSDSVVIGNHDHAVLGLSDHEIFNPFARESILWTESVLTRENREKLLSMPITKHEEDLFLVHAAPERPEKWYYISSLIDAGDQFDFFEGMVCLIGHTHRPEVYIHDGKEVVLNKESMLTFQREFRYIVNVGSVGQPRDMNPDAAYVLYNTKENTLTSKRVKYNIRLTQEKMRTVQLPSFLIKRLELGT